MFNYNDKKYRFNDASYSPKQSTQHGKKSPLEDDEIEIIGANSAIGKNFSPIGRQNKNFTSRSGI